jgi:hypothetical protein
VKQNNNKPCRSPTRIAGKGPFRSIRIFCGDQYSLPISECHRFLNVSTRPIVNISLGFTIEEALKEIVIRRVESPFESKPRERRAGP